MIEHMFEYVNRCPTPARPVPSLRRHQPDNTYPDSQARFTTDIRALKAAMDLNEFIFIPMLIVFSIGIIFGTILGLSVIATLQEHRAKHGRPVLLRAKLSLPGQQAHSGCLTQDGPQRLSWIPDSAKASPVHIPSTSISTDFLGEPYQNHLFQKLHYSLPGGGQVILARYNRQILLQLTHLDGPPLTRIRRVFAAAPWSMLWLTAVLLIYAMATGRPEDDYRLSLNTGLIVTTALTVVSAVVTALQWIRAARSPLPTVTLPQEEAPPLCDPDPAPETPRQYEAVSRAATDGWVRCYKPSQLKRLAHIGSGALLTGILMLILGGSTTLHDLDVEQQWQTRPLTTGTVVVVSERPFIPLLINQSTLRLPDGRLLTSYHQAKPRIGESIEATYTGDVVRLPNDIGPTVLLAFEAGILLVGGWITISSISHLYGRISPKEAPTEPVSYAAFGGPGDDVLLVLLNAAGDPESTVEVTATIAPSGTVDVPVARQRYRWWTMTVRGQELSQVRRSEPFSDADLNKYLDPLRHKRPWR